MRRLLLLILILTTVAHAAPHGMVVSDNAQASRAGVAVLQQGGNAVDAAVAVATTLAVTFPQAGNLGGGGFMLIRLPNGRVTSIDFRETAPAATTRSMYFSSPRASIVGYRAVGIPGTPAGLELAWRKYGTRKFTWSALLLPALRLAENGYQVSPGLAKDIAASHQLQANPEAKRIFSGLRAGDVLRQPELARTLLRLSQLGAEDFYRGVTARRIVADMARHGGLITAADLAGYRAVERQPLEGTYRGYRIISMPPPSSGGAILLEMLNMLEAWHGGGL
ncbi:MAG: gamma-glutamyltransferase, partial [Candidatus Xenobia bacterium]